MGKKKLIFAVLLIVACALAGFGGAKIAQAGEKAINFTSTKDVTLNNLKTAYMYEAVDDETGVHYFFTLEEVVEPAGNKTFQFKEIWPRYDKNGKIMVTTKKKK